MLYSYFGRVDDDIIQQIEEAERDNRIVAIVVDAWTLRLAQYGTPMSAYDSRKFLNCAVLVCWNSGDDELTETKRSELTQLLRETFHRNIINPSPNCFLEIHSHDELVKELPTMLSMARKRISEKAEVMKIATSDRIIGKPMITGVRRASP
jgi:FxsC-like protein